MVHSNLMEDSLPYKNTGPILANGNLRIQQRTHFAYNTILRYKNKRKHALQISNITHNCKKTYQNKEIFDFCLGNS